MDLDVPDQKPAPRKLRFQPKPQGRRRPPPVAPKVEVTDDAESAEAKELLRRFQDSLTAKPKIERKVEPSQVTFGYGSSMPNSQYNGNMASYQGKPSVSIPKEEKEYKEPWNYYSNYPVTLPLRRPYSGRPDLLDEEEFERASAYDETMTNSAFELGLLDDNPEPRMLLLKLPKALPMTKRATSAAGQPSSSNSKPPSGAGLVEKTCGLNDLQAGFMGKMLVYKSGAVKLKLGETLYDVTPGSDCAFAQDVAMVNVKEKQCCVVGDLNKHAVLTPDVDSILDNFVDLG